ncbi:DUF6069 family protein [Micromonospora sp. WMMD1102]|uniref:DUF6069 family protein n=1 Tax=Micromonospora sp. WMMD1102 TaxID=3016105 RepID=UPI002415665C|nr:DUF6069 family protein [Micromonospora sp. WMMD1102]MDG4791169.1 DUF6069 family protein [Micromonospora sp. WMMD1102]
MRRLPRPGIVGLAVVAAVLGNLVLYAVGRAAGGTFRFTTPQGPAEVDALTVAGFSAVPLLVGLAAVALLAPLAGWISRVATIVGAALAVVTIAVMTLPADLDATSKTILALCHLTLVPIILVAVPALDPRRRAGPSRGAA